MKDKSKEPYEDKVRPHVYDGIQEYDNRLPNWWLWTFYGAIIISVMYWFSRYNAEIMQTDEQRIAAEMSIVEEARLAAMGDINNETLWQMSRNEGFVKAGKSVYMSTCLACHGPNLEGGTGLSLVDQQWKWGNTPESVYLVVANGSPDKTAGMAPWISALGPEKVKQVVSFVLSHHDEQEMSAAPTENPPRSL